MASLLGLALARCGPVYGALGAGAWGLPAAAALLGAALRARALRCRPVVLRLGPGRRLGWTREDGKGGEGRAVFDERWPLAVLRAEGRGPAFLFWPDTLAPSGRRLLRRWARTAPDSPLPTFWT